jgi:hypothetical protein
MGFSPTSTSIGFGTPVPRPYSGLGADCSVRFPGFFDVAPLIRSPPAFSVTAGRNTGAGRSGRQIMQGARGRSSSEGRSSGRPSAVVLPFLSPASGERNGRDGSFLYSSRDRRIFRSSGRNKWMRHARLVICHCDKFLDEIKPACQRVARCRPA